MVINPQILHDQGWRSLANEAVSFQRITRYKIILNILAFLKPKKILDMGCGSGYIADYFKRMFPQAIIHGFDISCAALERVKNIDLKFSLDIDKEDINQENGYYDVVICSEILEHLYDVDHALKEVHRVLRSGGIGIITVPNYSFWRYRISSLFGNIPLCISDQRHIRVFNYKLLRDMVMRAGFLVYKYYGCRDRFDFLNNFSKTFFSDVIVLEVQKP